MRTGPLSFALIAVVAVCLVSSTVIGQVERPKPREARMTTEQQSAQLQTPVNHDAIASKLVNNCAGIKKGEMVLISGGIQHFDLLESIAVKVRSAGAFPLVTVSSERMIRRMWDDVPAEYDSQTPKLGLQLASLVDATISVDFVENNKLLAHVPTERRAARAKAGAPVGEAFMANNVRQINLGNALNPTPARAAQFGISQQELAKIYWAGVNTDPQKLAATGKMVSQKLNTGRTLRLTHSNGTDLTLGIANRKVLISDGVVSESEAKSGGASGSVWLPAGEVYLAPEPGSANGTVIIDRHFFEGREINKLKLTFANGKLTSMTAESGLSGLKALYDAAGAGKDVFGVIDIGINPDVTIPENSKMVAWMPAGMVTVMIGNNTWAGGENNTAYALAGHLMGTTLTVDGNTLIENGKLQN